MAVLRPSCVPRSTPLWPAGHLPHKGGDHKWRALCPSSTLALC